MLLNRSRETSTTERLARAAETHVICFLLFNMCFRRYRWYRDIYRATERLNMKIDKHGTRYRFFPFSIMVLMFVGVCSFPVANHGARARSIRISHGARSGYRSDQLLDSAAPNICWTSSSSSEAGPRTRVCRRVPRSGVESFNDGCVRVSESKRARARACADILVPVLWHGALYRVRDESERTAR